MQLIVPFMFYFSLMSCKGHKTLQQLQDYILKEDLKNSGSVWPFQVHFSDEILQG